MALNKAKVFTITSVKGGVGKTTTALNLAGIYSRLEKRVLIIDLDLYSGDIASLLNINYNNDIYNLYEDMSNNKFTNLDDYVTSYNEQIKVLPAPKDPRFARKISSKILNLILYKASMKFDVILIDTNHILTDINLFAFDFSDQILYLINNDSMNLKNMKTIVSILNDMNKNNYKIILNQSNDRDKNYYNKYDIKNIINKTVNYIVPSNFYIKNIDKYIIEGNILTLNENIYKKYKEAMKIYNLIALDILKESKVD
ncbi:MAG: tyrosine-protein kinase family protein [Bacilli bacterium]|nr:tyrosine-protein kinase family protein [Bacilli bacterium]